MADVSRNESSILPTNLSIYSTNCFLAIYNIYINDIESVYRTSMALCVLNYLTSICAINGNGLIIRAISSTPSLHSPCNVLLCCLAFADFLTGVVTVPAFVVSIVARIAGVYPLYCTASVASYLPVYYLSGVSFLTLTAVTVDRCLALRLHLRYRQVITIRRVLVVEALLWFVPVLVVMLPAFVSYGAFEITVAGMVLFSLVINAVSYAGIASTLHRHRRSVMAEQQLTARFHGQSVVETRKVSRSWRTIAGMFVLCCVCYGPTVWIMIASALGHGYDIHTPSVRLIRDAAASVVFANAVINPLLLCYRITEIRKAVIVTAKKLMC